MLGWLIALIVSLASCIIILIILLLVLTQRRFFVDQQVPTTTVTTTTTDVTSTQTERRSSYQHLFRRGTSTKLYFNWADHPSLINEAVETGWSRFAFMTSHAQTPSARPSLFGSLRVAGDYYYCRDSSSSRHPVVEESWEIGSGAVDFMQKLHFKNSHGLNGTHHHPSSTPKSTVRMSLPLPGPPMVDSFPQEAYFEISVLSSSEVNDKNNGIGEEEKSKLLIKQSYKSSSVPSSAFASVGGDGGLFHVTSSRGGHVLEELRRGQGGGGGGVKMTIGLSVGGLVNNRVPGSYAGSIGFNSDGSVFLSGMKLVFESEKEDWAKTGKVIGCGFDPRKKKVYFTVDSELVHVIHCKSEDFGMPLYPIITSSIDITLLVNLGQSSFNYAPPNAARTPNPCFICPIVNSSAAAALGYEDSRELFSMGRRLDDDEWLSHSATTKSTFSNSSEVYCNNMRNSMVGENEELETEFFEIVLDNKGR